MKLHRDEWAWWIARSAADDRARDASGLLALAVRWHSTRDPDPGCARTHDGVRGNETPLKAPPGSGAPWPARPCPRQIPRPQGVYSPNVRLW